MLRTAFHSRPVSRLAGAALVAAALTGCSTSDAEVTPGQAAQIDALVAEYVPSIIPGLQVGVGHGGQVIFERGYGRADVKTGAPMSNATPVRIGSVTKQFTAVATLVLHDRGKLSLDDPLTRWLPELKYPQTPTVRQLVQMVAGVPGDDDSDIMGTPVETLREPPPTTVQLLARINTRGPIAPPSGVYDYSNAGYTLLGLVIERASGSALAPALDELLFRPAGMTQTRMYDGRTLPGEAVGHFRARVGDAWLQCPDLNSGFAAAGGLISTVADLARWNGAWLDGRIIPASLLTVMRTEPTLSDGRKSPIGMGVANLGAGVGYGAAGQTVQYAAWNATYDTGLDISLLANGSNNGRDADYPRAALSARIHNVLRPDRPVPMPPPATGDGAGAQDLADLLALCR